MARPSDRDVPGVDQSDDTRASQEAKDARAKDVAQRQGETTKDVVIEKDMNSQYRFKAHKPPLSRREKEEMKPEDIQAEEEKRKNLRVESQYRGHAFASLEDAKDFADDHGLNVKGEPTPHV